MTDSLLDPEFPALQPEVVALLTTIRDHLDVPLPAAGKKNRRAHRDVVDMRLAEVQAVLVTLLAIPLENVAEHTAELRDWISASPVNYQVWQPPTKGARP
ncbi:hypothetical protein [Streptomyces sp. PH10-H1]|uniref:hypothetical protein n=1 Tax=Streptomyces sp. PH10-H1 TaxID=3046212 RepID=UPI0024B92A39|nr:hypothetical protein [Streptomyces sp. PH10-H1]MDJ0346750.1 hypothetical protein [Streptomyces sp. PH10-H1]